MTYITLNKSCKVPVFYYLTRLPGKIQHMTTSTKWAIFVPAYVLIGYYPPNHSQHSMGVSGPPMGGYGVIKPQYKGEIAESTPMLDRFPPIFG